MDVNMPRDKETGKPRGFAFIMYEDQRSTVLAVDNLNGIKIKPDGRTLRVDHVKNYKQPKTKGDDGEWIEPEEQSMNAKPQLIGEYLPFCKDICVFNDGVDDGAESESSESSGPAIDPEDPMAEFLLAQWKEERALKKGKKSKSKGKHKDETPEERKARKARKKERKAKKEKLKQSKSEGVRGVEDLLASLGGRGVGRERTRSRSRDGAPARQSPFRDRSRYRSRSRSRSPRGRNPAESDEYERSSRKDYK